MSENGEINILSLFDGISTGYIALKRAGIEFNKYYASEIDRYAIAVSRYNHRDIIHLGDVRKVKCENLPRIDLLIGDSPCQGFSIAGKRLNFDDPRSKLFFEFVRLLKECQPEYFLLENVRMKQEWEDIISGFLGVEPILIDSALVSAQQRKRLYWTNIPVKELPEDKHIYLKDILEYGYTEKEKSYCLTSTYSGACARDYFLKHSRQMIFNKPIRVGTINKGSQGERVYSIDGKSVCLNANGGGMGAKTGLYIIAGALRSRYSDKDNVEISNIKTFVRKLTPVECERLQTLPDNYTKYGLLKGLFGGKIIEIPKTERYRMLGNAWTADVIAHIFQYIVKIKQIKRRRAI